MADPAPLAIVTGGAGGLGREIARRLLEDGYRVALVDLEHDALAATQVLLAAPGDALRCFACDVADVDAARAAVGTIAATMGVPYALVTCAGIGPLAPILEIAPATWSRVLAVNLDGTFWFAQAAGRLMVTAGRGRIVTISSVSGQRAGFGRGAYGPSKAAVIHLTRQLAVELGPCGVTVNSVAPGPVETRLARDHHTPEVRANYHETIPLARYGWPEEMSAVVAFLCSDGAGYVNGQTIFVDGGFTAGGVAVRMAQTHAQALRSASGAGDSTNTEAGDVEPAE
jgi:NAD(P)-dependent dehydrogenase (short-subunit alcohol dehydrogenase family)